MTEESPLAIDPESILANLALFASAEEYQELFDKFCQSALNEHYSWDEGGPGNLLFICERIEMLIEAAYLANINKTNSQQLKHCSETSYAFFNRQSLGEWKREYNKWVQAAFNNETVSNEIPSSSIHPFILNMKMLLNCIPSTMRSNK